MMRIRLALLGLLAVSACASNPEPRRVYPPRQLAGPGQWHQEASYGFTAENPIRIGGGPRGEYLFFEVLRGPEGQPVAWRRVGGCCEFETYPGHLGGLDIYEVIYEGLSQPVTLYLDVFHSEPVFAPRGFTLFVQEWMEPEPPGPPPPKQQPRRSPEIIEL